MSVLSLLIIAAMMLVPMEPELFRLLGFLDAMVCAVFFLDFLR